VCARAKQTKIETERFEKYLDLLIQFNLNQLKNFEMMSKHTMRLIENNAKLISRLLGGSEKKRKNENKVFDDRNQIARVSKKRALVAFNIVYCYNSARIVIASCCGFLKYVIFENMIL